VLKYRVIPLLLLMNGGLVKTIKFKDPTYIGDPINAVKIFNDKEVDELVIMDIMASKENKSPDFALLLRIAKEAFMPMAYGGGITKIDQIKTLLGLGFEKIIINSFAIDNLHFIQEASRICGSQSVVIALDVKKSIFGEYRLFRHLKNKITSIDPMEYAREVERSGAGEIILNNVDRDGMMSGYDIELIKKISSNVQIPVVAVGGAGNTVDLVKAVKEGGASAIAAGSMFVFHGRNRAVLINYPEKKELIKLFSQEPNS